MAQEITATVGLSVSKTNGPVFTYGTQAQKIDLSGSRYSAGVQDIGTTVEQVVIASDMSTAGWCVFKNLDATNYVEIGASNGTPYFLRLNAGESCVVRLTTTTFYAKANTSAVKLQFMLLES